MFLVLGGKMSNRLSQQQIVSQLLRRARADGRDVEVPELMRAGVAHFTARIFELRRRGFVILNHQSRDASGRVRSRYTLAVDPEQQSNAEDRR
jgi:hypothetical protein